MAGWTEYHLGQLFARYNRRYWDGRIPHYTLRIAPMADAVGRCDRRRRMILIDLARHESDREVGDTLLHEMCHAADRSGGRVAHGYGFFRELEMLLRKGSPIRLGCPEMPGVRFWELAVPKKFPLCRKAAERMGLAREREMEREITKGQTAHEVTDEEIIGRFDDAAVEGLTWKEALWAVGHENGLLDVGGRPIDAWARRLVRRGRARHGATRRMLLEGERMREAMLRARDSGRQGTAGAGSALEGSGASGRPGPRPSSGP